MSKLSLEDQLAALHALRAGSSELGKQAMCAKLRPFLQQPNNLVAARAADLALELELRDLLGELESAFRRFLGSPARKDPQCWAKNALSKALHHLGCEDSSLFLAGLHVHQYEPVWGGQSDVAGTLRSNCAHALVDCRELPHHVLLLHLVDLFADEDASVRHEVVRAVTQAGGESAILLLRLRALTAVASMDEPRVIGQCYAGLLALEGTAAIPFLARFLKKQDDCSAEAAIALGETRTPESLEALLSCLPPESAGPHPHRTPSAVNLEPWFAGVLLSAIAMTRQAKATDTLLQLVATESGLAEAAIEALATANLGPEVQQRLAAMISSLGAARLSRCYARHFPNSPGLPGAANHGPVAKG